MDKIGDLMGKWHRHREMEIYLTTYDGAQHLRLHGWLKRNDTLIKTETITNKENHFGNFIVFITENTLDKLKEQNLEKGLFVDLEVMSTESDRWNLYQDINQKNESEDMFEKIQDFLFSFQIRDKKDIDKFLTQANETSLALFKKNDEFVQDYIETKELSESEKIRDLDLMIDNFVEQERYEDCSFLVKIKKRIEKYYIEIHTNNLLKNLKK
tara:strand:+ start:1844 stop:2479 length:636 start_codon:yes stop_codon:yes gene_type:complete